MIKLQVNPEIESDTPINKEFSNQNKRNLSVILEQLKNTGKDSNFEISRNTQVISTLISQ